MATPILQSRLRCPACGHEAELEMPTDACVFLHPCDGCGALLRPAEGDCCVFCSYGSVSCPPMQHPGADGVDCCQASSVEDACGE
jgi:hypothetical protein